jgi:acetyl-CoA carboxylase biotin carboxyl carrier protein
MKKTIHAPMAGTLWKIVKTEGDSVDYGDTVAILESMKMEISIEADNSGTITKFLVKEGDVVDDGTPIAELS